MPNLTTLTTLQQISQQTIGKSSNIHHHQYQLQHLASTIAVIVDITYPIYRQKQQNYLIQIKLIDQTVNQSVIQTPYLMKYLTLYIIADKKEQLMMNNLKIGDLLILEKFLFYQWSKIQLQAKCYCYGAIEVLYHVEIVNGNNISGNGDSINIKGQSQQQYKLVKLLGKGNNINNNNNHIQFLSNRITQLKHYLQLNFNKIFAPFYGVKIINNYCSLIQPFSMLLKLDKIEQNQFSSFVFMKDSNENVFYLDGKNFRLQGFKNNQWFYVRGVKNVTVDRQILLTLTGNVIKMPAIFNIDEYQKQSNYQAIYRKTSKITNQKQQTTALTYINLFEQKPSTVKQLFDLQDKYKGTGKKHDIILQNNYLIKGVVIKYTGRIKLYHTQYQMIVHDNFLLQVPTQQKKQIIQDKKLKYIFQGTIFLIDRSINSKKQSLTIRLFTNDSKSTFFDESQLQRLNLFIGHSNSQQRTKQVLNKILNKLQKLKQLSTFDNPASLVLQPIRSDELIYRLINTKIV